MEVIDSKKNEKVLSGSETPVSPQKSRVAAKDVRFNVERKNTSIKMLERRNKSSSNLKADGATKNVLPEIGKEFLVTHLSDNWKIRKAAKQAAIDKLKLEEQTKKEQVSADQQVAEISLREEVARDLLAQTQQAQDYSKAVSPAPELTQNNLEDLRRRRQSADDAILGRHRGSVTDILKRISERKKSLLLNIDASVARRKSGEFDFTQTDPKLSTSGQDDQSVRDTPRDTILEEAPAPQNDELVDSTPLQNVDDAADYPYSTEFDLDDDASSDYSDSPTPLNLELDSDHFDTDLSDNESGNEGPGKDSKPKRPVNKTLLDYKLACVQSQLKPNTTYMRQCGRTSIDIRNRMLTHNDARPIAIALVEDKKTSFLDISDNPLGPLGTACIAEMLTSNETVVELNVSNTQPGREGLLALAQALKSNNSLRRLFLDSNGIGQSDGDVIAQLVTDVPDLRELYVSNNALGFNGGRKIALALASDKGRLSVLDLQYNNIRTESAVQIALSLARNTTLRSLNLAWNGLGTEGCRALAMSLGANTSLTELDLTCNRLGLRSLEFLLKGLSKNTGLNSIKIGNNPLTTGGVKALLKTILEAKDSEITSIDLQGIPIDVECVQLIEELHDKKGVHVIHDPNIHMATSDQTKDFDGTNLDRFDPVMVMFEYMKKDNLRVIDLFQFLDAKKREKLSRNDVRSGFNILMIPFTEHAIDVIMEKVDINKDGYITLDEMTKSYRENDRAVKLRRIRANKRKKKDNGLEDLWKILKEIIAKRKTENDKRAGANNK
ncbi:unnamed protein product [Lymnaea stagnalis]|uniref:EF-hand domain-containing protein n=1 Tax=Lymnaea stagnalis TaxID=6523 RepID=A0AAV2HKF8_LYMST